MRLGLQIPSFTWAGGTNAIALKLARIAGAAEAAGFASLWVMDHFFQIEMIGKPEEPMLEGYSALSFLAAVTKRVQLGTLVTGVIYRRPAVLIKTVTTLDVLSGGRAYFGVGAGWYRREAVGLGIPFPPLKERFEVLEETLQIAHRMWSGDTAPFHGKHYQLAEPLNSPQPITKPHPPIMVGGSGERKTLRLVAQYADACNLYAVEAGAETIRAKLAVLRLHCDDLGRSYDDIERTALGVLDLRPGGMSASQAIDFCGELSEAGIDHLIVSLSRVDEITPIEIMGKEVIPAVADLCQY
ncbi:MAG TPA: LLM class F420-dependent oxidoreductase [Candidatus Binatia bacterium]|nr:LLM class F420-dependent oxidoreductase [Candidatus Binatia bacterium]